MLAGACLQTILQNMQDWSNVNLSTKAILAFINQFIWYFNFLFFEQIEVAKND
jgi:hypothetical protein